MNRKIISALLLFIIALVGVTEASALPGYLDNFNTTYPFVVGTRIDTCLLCHVNPAGTGDLNMYGKDFSNTHNFTAIESLDSDGDGFTNIEEIITLTFPGNSSDNINSAASTATGTTTATSNEVSKGTVTGTPTMTGASAVTETPTVIGNVAVTPTVTLTSAPMSTPGVTRRSPGFEILIAITAVLVAILVRRR